MWKYFCEGSETAEPPHFGLVVLGLVLIGQVGLGAGLVAKYVSLALGLGLGIPALIAIVALAAVIPQRVVVNDRGLFYLYVFDWKRWLREPDGDWSSRFAPWSDVERLFLAKNLRRYGGFQYAILRVRGKRTFEFSSASSIWPTVLRYVEQHAPEAVRDVRDRWWGVVF